MLSQLLSTFAPSPQPAPRLPRPRGRHSLAPAPAPPSPSPQPARSSAGFTGPKQPPFHRPEAAPHKPKDVRLPSCPSLRPSPITTA
eukprot:scaffold83595_cov39-Phaeocystis_antarctica.AAC.1